MDYKIYEIKPGDVEKTKITDDNCVIDTHKTINLENAKIDTLIIRENVYNEIRIDDCTINNLIIDGNILINLSGMFQGCKINNLKYTPRATLAGPDQFSYCNIKNVDFGNIQIIGSSAIAKCVINNIKWSEDLKTIQECAFYETSFPPKVKLPDSLRYIGTKAFQFAYITDIEFGNKLEVIGNYAFFGTQISEVILPESINYLDKKAFYGLMKLTLSASAAQNSYITDEDIEMAQDIKIIPGEIKPIKNEIIVDDVLYAILGLQYEKEKIIDVKEIAPFAFGKNVNNKTTTYSKLVFTRLEKTNPYSFDVDFVSNNVIIPKTLKKIAPFTFDASNIKKINLEYVEEIGEYAFAYSNLQEANLKSIKKLREGAFYESDVIDIVVPGLIKEIPPKCFTHIRKIELEEGIEKIDEYAIQCLKEIEEIKLPNTLKEIKSRGIIFFNSPEHITLNIPVGIQKLAENFTNYREINIKIPISARKAFDFELKGDEKFEFYKPTLDDLIEQGCSISELNQIYKANEER